MLLLSRFNRVWLCVTPQIAAHQALQSLGFFRQEYWNGLPFPYPMHESEEWKWSRSVGPNSLRPHGLQPTRLLHSWNFPGKSTGVGCHSLDVNNYLKSNYNIILTFWKLRIIPNIIKYLVSVQRFLSHNFFLPICSNQDWNSHTFWLTGTSLKFLWICKFPSTSSFFFFLNSVFVGKTGCLSWNFPLV